MDDQLQAIYTTKSKRPPPKPKKPRPALSFIPQEQFDQLPDQVKENITQQHTCFCDLLKKAQRGYPGNPIQ